VDKPSSFAKVVRMGNIRLGNIRLMTGTRSVSCKLGIHGLFSHLNLLPLGDRPLFTGLSRTHSGAHVVRNARAEVTLLCSVL